MTIPVPDGAPEIGSLVTTNAQVEAYYSGYGGQPVMWFRPGMAGRVACYAAAVRNTGRGDILCIVDFEAKPGMITRQDLPTPPWRVALGLRQVVEAVETRVTFRTWRTMPYSVIAILWDMPHNPGHVLMYEHVGQHGEGTLGVIYRTRLADPTNKGVIDLKAELIGRGYILTTVPRRPKDWS